MDKERELDALAEVLLILTKELVENPTFAIKDAFKYVHREFVTETLASEAAYYDFLNKTGKDIRNCNWYGGKIQLKNGDILNINSEYTAEHMQTGKQFRYELINAYKNGALNKEFIKSKLKGRYLCWVTKEEDKRLTILGYKSDRSNPEQAYKEAGIVIYKERTSVFLSSTVSDSTQKHTKSLPYFESQKELGKGERSKIGEYFTFTNERIETKRNVLAYSAYNESGKNIGYVFETLDKRTPAYKNSELRFFEEYKGKKYCRFTSLGEKVSWLHLSERIKQEQKVTLYID